jgi:RNA polymerase sigma-70 factor (ECF subfamily)
VEVDALRDEPLLAGYPYAAAARADFLRRLGRLREAGSAYEEALLLTTNDVERAFLDDRLALVKRSSESRDSVQE